MKIRLRSACFRYLLAVLALAVSGAAMAQIPLKGKVSNKLEEPLIGVSVLLKGTTTGAMTDENGEFSLTVPAGAPQPVLVFSYVGYITKEEQVAGRTTVNVVLEMNDTNLDEIVVVGYGTQSKRNLSGSVSDIKSTDIVRASTTTASGALAGKIQGISVRAKDARPGRGAVLEVRNMGTPLS